MTKIPDVLRQASLRAKAQAANPYCSQGEGRKPLFHLEEGAPKSVSVIGYSGSRIENSRDFST